MTLNPSIDYRVVNPQRTPAARSSVYDWVLDAAERGIPVQIDSGYVTDGAVELDSDGEVGITYPGGIMGYVSPESLVPYESPDPVTALEAARAEVARLEALVAAEDAIVTERALAMREVWLAASHGHNVIDLWKAVARAFPA